MALSKKGSREKLVFSSIVYPGKASETNSLLLAESIREFGGALSKQPIWFFMPKLSNELSLDTLTRFQGLDVDVVSFEMDQEVLKFPFTGHAEAAAKAESRANENANLLAWLAPNTLVLHEPTDFILDSNMQLGYRPVHHKLLGLLYNEPLDSFWTLVYNHCGVKETHVFPMKPHVEDEPIKPYFNAGSLIVRPEKKLFSAWRDSFLDVYRNPTLLELYKKDQRNAIFIHQAILSGVLLTILDRNEMVELPTEYNYPIHLFEEDATTGRPKSLEDCITLRHETFHKDPNWHEKIQLSDSLKDWIKIRLLN
jgi:hypothetical protein